MVTDFILSGHANTGGGSRLRRRLRHGRAGGGGRAPHGASLNDRNRGETCRIVRLHSHGATRRRFLDMGFLPGALVMVVRAAPLEDPIEIRVGDSHVTVRRDEAAGIEVEDV